MKFKSIRAIAMVLCGVICCASAHSAPIFNRSGFDIDAQSVQLDSQVVVANRDSGNGGGWIEALFLGVMPSDAISFLRAAMELAPARFAVNSEATISFRTNTRP